MGREKLKQTNIHPVTSHLITPVTFLTMMFLIIKLLRDNIYQESRK